MNHAMLSLIVACLVFFTARGRSASILLPSAAAASLSPPDETNFDGAFSSFSTSSQSAAEVVERNRRQIHIGDGRAPLSHPSIMATPSSLLVNDAHDQSPKATDDASIPLPPSSSSPPLSEPPLISGGVEGGMNGRTFSSVEDLWRQELYDPESGALRDIYDAERGWYGRAQSFWQREPPTLDGVLGGTTRDTHVPDIKGSRRFVMALEREFGIVPGGGRALDVGCGMGRVSEGLLVKRFKTIDIADSAPLMLAAAEAMLRKKGRLGLVFNTSVERMAMPTTPTYDFILMQWVIMYLTDNDAVAFLQKCKASLRNTTVTRTVRRRRKRGHQKSASETGGVEEVDGDDDEEVEETIVLNRTGVVFIKENVMHGNAFLLGKEDLALNRCDAHYKRLFALAGLTVVHEAMQEPWPSYLVPLKMYALV